MGVFSFLKPHKHQTFSYKPRYWDPKKEEAEQRRERIRRLEEGGVENMKVRIRGGFRGGGVGREAMGYRSARTKKSNVRLLIILVCLFVLAAVLTVYYVPDFDAALNNPNDGLEAPVGPPTE